MTDVFFSVLKASFQGSIVILAVLVLRLLLKKAPRSIFCLLWLLAGLRLVLPFEIESSFSLQPRLEKTQLSIQDQQPVQVPDILVQNPEGQPLDTPPDPIQRPTLPEGNGENLQTENLLYGVQDGVITGPLTLADIAAPIWLLGIGVMLAASGISYIRLKRRVREAYLIENGCFECPGLDTAFVLGFMPPKIYLPMGLTDQEKKFIFDHENTHIARHDHWYKLLGYAVLSLHWFNPLVWIGYGLLCRDIELACDEHVVKYMSLSQRKAYSAALLSCGSHTSRIAACPVAFGESNPKQRILNVLNYKRPSFWISLLAVVAVVFVAVCLMTSPDREDPSLLNYRNIPSIVQDQDLISGTYNHTGDDPDDNQGYFSMVKVEGNKLADYLNDVQWREPWFTPQNQVGLGHISLSLNDALTITVYEARFCKISYDGEVRYYRTRAADFQNLLNLLSDLMPKDMGYISPTDQCRAVLEDFQSRNAIHILELYTFSGDGLPEGQIDRNYFRSGDTWLRIDSADSNYTGVLHSGSVVYTGDSESTVIDWQVTDAREDMFPQPWLLSFDFTAADAEVISTQETDDGYALRLMVREPIDIGWLQGSEYYVDFAFDREDNFLRATAHVSEGFSEMTIQMLVPDVFDTDVVNSIRQFAGALVNDAMEDEDYLALCRDALAELQGRMQFHISETLAYFTGDQEDSRSNVAFWRDEANWLRSSYATRLRENHNHLYYDGWLYYQVQGEEGDPTWNRLNTTNGAEYGLPWLCSLQWDNQIVTFNGAVQEGEELRVSVTVHSTPPTLGWDDVVEHNVMFCFDQSGALTRAIMAAYRDNIKVIDDIKIETTLAANIRDKIEQFAAQRPPEVCVGLPLAPETYLQLCGTALENYQSQGSWVILVDRQFSGPDAMNESSSQLWYIHAEDWLRQSIISEADFYQENWYLKKGDQSFSRESITVHDPANGEDYDSGWEEREDLSGWALPWCLEFDWGSEDITFIENRTDGSSNLVTFRVQGSPMSSHNKEVEEYDVSFWLHASGEVWKIQLAYTETRQERLNGEDHTAQVYVVATISPNASAPEEAAKMIALKYQEITK